MLASSSFTLTLVPRLLRTLISQPLSTLTLSLSSAALQSRQAPPPPSSLTLCDSRVTDLCEHGDPGLRLFDVRQEGVGEGDHHTMSASHPHSPAQETARGHRLLRPHLHRQGGPQEQ